MIRIFLIIYFLLFSSYISAKEPVNEIVIITNDIYDIKVSSTTKYKSKFINLDDHKKTMKILNSRIDLMVDQDPFKKSNLQDAYIKAFNKFMKTSDWNEFYKKIMESSEDKVFLIKKNIKKIPAIIINGDYIIYGVTDMDLAVKYYLEYGS